MIFEQISTKNENPTKSGWYNTDKGKLFWFNDEQNWSCRDDRMSEEYPSVWYKEQHETEWDSQAIIGRVKERNKELSGKGFHWSSFYNGWLEGRVDMLRQCKFNPPNDKAEAIAFSEWIQIKGYIQSSNDLWYLHSDGNPNEGTTIELLYTIYKKEKEESK